MEYLIHILIFVSIWAALSVSLNLVIGYTGLISFTHAAFFGIGAYSTGILMTRFSMNFFLTILIGVTITFIVSFLLGLVLQRFKSDYYALVSIGFNTIVWSLMLNYGELTRGALGIPGIARPEIFGISFSSNTAFLVLTLLTAYGIFMASSYIVKSPLGRVVKAIREDEKILQVFGYSTGTYKMIIFCISASMAAIMGSVYASYISFIDPSTFILSASVAIVTMVILGGLGSIQGSILGAIILVVLPEALRFVGFSPEIAAQMRNALYGLILIIIMMYYPKGIMGEYKM